METECTEEATCWFAVLPKNVKLVQNIYFKMPGIAAVSRPLCGGDMFDTDCHLCGHPTLHCAVAVLSYRQLLTLTMALLIRVPTVDTFRFTKKNVKGIIAFEP